MPVKLKLPAVNDNTKRDIFKTDISKCNDPKLYSHDGVIDRINLDKWVLPNRKDFMDFLKNDFNTATFKNKRKAIKLWLERDSKFIDISPFKHQKFVSDYLSEYSPYRGLLLYHGLGSGKSGASIMIGEGFLNRHVVILLPASLRDNYITEISTFAEIAYKKNYHWCKIRFEEGTSKLEREYMEMFNTKNLDKELIDKIVKNKKIGSRNIRSIWMIDYTKDAPNYDMLSEQEQSEVNDQIKIMIDHKYSILHYNAGQYTITKILERLIPNYQIIYSKLFGEMSVSKMTNKDRDILLNYIYNPDNNIDNPFNNKILIVDEIHNLTSKMVGSGFNGSRLYELIIRATNLKIVFLSGTPVINNPFELALMFNMLRGFIYQYRIPLEKKAGNFNQDELLNILYKVETIDRINIDISSKYIEITRLPLNFINKYSGDKKIGVEYSKNNSISEKDFLADVLRSVFSQNYQQNGTIERTMFTIFPGILQNSEVQGSMRGSEKYMELAEKNFSDTYIDKTSLNVMNVREFKNRILGLVSFYNEISGIDEATGADLFPDKIYALDDEVTVKMSNFQFIEYAAKRRIERKLEDASKKQRGMDEAKANATQKMPSLFKVFSRQKGVFVFPPSIKRPTPPKNNKFLKKTVTKSEYYNLSDEEMDTIITKLKSILRNDDTKNRITMYTEYINSFDIDSSEYQFIEAVIREIMSNYSEIDEYLEWISSHDFEEDTFEVSDVIEEDELDYKTQCINAIDKLTEEHLTVNDTGIDLETLSPKYSLMLKNIQNSPGNVFCYSQFRSVEGIEIFSKALFMNGYTKLYVPGMTSKPDNYDTIEIGNMVRYESEDDEWKSYKVIDIENDKVILEGLEELSIEKSRVFKCRYALWTGTESVEVRRGIQNVYNSTENMYGQQCLILLTTQSGSEGISLMNVRQVHVMEPYWNNVRIDQVIGRARRIKSHIYLPERHRNVKIFQYIIKFTDKQTDGTWIADMSDSDIIKMKDGEDSGFVNEEFVSDDSDDDPDNINGFHKYAKILSSEVKEQDKGITSDEVLYKIAKNKEEILSAFLKCIKEASVDCEYNWNDNVKSDKKLEEIKCYNIISNDSDYSFDLVTNESKVSQKKEVVEKTVQRKLLNMSIMVNKKKVRIIISIPESLYSLTSINDILDKLPNGYDQIFDYYLFNNLYYKDMSKRNPLVNIGRLVKKQPDVSFRFTDMFNSRVDDYSIIEDCIKANGNMPKENVEKIKWADVIKSCHKNLIEPVSWKCPGCDTEYGVDTEECDLCSLTKEDILSLHRDTVSTTSVSKVSETKSSTSSQSSVKSKGSTRRMKF